jgi:hypothetical protein
VTGVHNDVRGAKQDCALAILDDHLGGQGADLFLLVRRGHKVGGMNNQGTDAGPLQSLFHRRYFALVELPCRAAPRAACEDLNGLAPDPGGLARHGRKPPRD